MWDIAYLLFIYQKHLERPNLYKYEVKPVREAKSWKAKYAVKKQSHEYSRHFCDKMMFLLILYKYDKPTCYSLHQIIVQQG